MEPLKERISARVARINAEITGKTVTTGKNTILSREALLDTLQALYDECSIESLQKYDANVAQFVEKHKKTLKELKQLRVNITDFEIKSAIGRGHFGEVHIVREKQTNDVYAMKTIKKNDNDIKRVSFEEERDIMAFNNSPWLTSLQYAFQDMSQLFFIMEYHPGGDLLGLLYRQGGTLPESAATFYVAELVLALADLHGMGYVHRDIKPDNVLLDRFGHLKLADFGSAAKLNKQGLVTSGPPVGTPDYIAPEVLQVLENKPAKGAGYGVCCDYWSLGVLAYEITVGNTPFTAPTTTSIYGKIMNHTNSLNFPSDIALTQAYIQFVKSLLTDQTKRLKAEQIKNHALFKDIKFEALRTEFAPFIPKIKSEDDTSNFTDVQNKKRAALSIENFKKKTQFSGRNLPFVGFTFTHDSNECRSDFSSSVKDEHVENLKEKVEHLHEQLMMNGDFAQEKESLEKKLEDKSRKLDILEGIRDKLEKDIANNVAECAALRRMLELERKDRIELERKALELIKSAKIKWETAEKIKVDALLLEIDQQKEKIGELTSTNAMLNEQLQHALHMEGKHKQSLENVENLSRRSVIGLECRLEKVTTDAQNAQHNLNVKLNNEMHAKSLLEKEVTNLKNRNMDLNARLKDKEVAFDVLETQVGLLGDLVENLRARVTELENELEEGRLCKNQNEKLLETVDEKQKTIKDLENNITLLKMDANALHGVKKEYEEFKAKQNKKINELESQLAGEEEKNKALKKQLKETETTITESQELRELRTKFWRMEKEFGNCKIDKRILERELKDAQAEAKVFAAKMDDLNKKMQDNKKANEMALLELSGINESLSLELMKVNDSYRNLQEKLSNEKAKSDDEKTVINELKRIIEKTNEKMEGLNKEVADKKMEKLKLEDQLKSSEQEKNKLMDLMNELQKEKMEIVNEVEKSQRELENGRLNLEALKEACLLLENQVLEYEKINTSFQAKETDLNTNTEKLIADLCKAKQEIQEAKKATNEEKSLKLLAETKTKRLEEKIAGLEIDCKSHKDIGEEYKQYCVSLSDELTAIGKRLADCEVKLKSGERANAQLKEQNNMLKEELSLYLTQINTVKESNYKLNRQVKEFNESNALLVRKLQELEIVIDEKEKYYRERFLKSESTIQQQSNLICFLQSKDQPSNKKGILSSMFTPSKKEYQLPNFWTHYKNLEAQLVREKMKNNNLEEEIIKLKAASALSTPTKLNSKTHDTIPHNFVQKISTKSATCAQCSDQITLSTRISICSDCSVAVHSDCAFSMPKNCGSATETKDVKTVSFTDLEGWVKVPNTETNSWEKRYAVLSNQCLKFYNSCTKSSTELVDSFELCPENGEGKVVLEPLASEIGVSVANSDLPFTMKVEVVGNTTGLPAKSLIFMTLSAKETDNWFYKLSKIFNVDIDNEKISTSLVVPDGLTVNCLIDLNDTIKVLGTDKGLYAYHNDSLLYIDGLTKVQHISFLPTANIILMIANAKNLLIYCDLNHLISLAQCASCTKPTIKYKTVNIKNLNGFHFLDVSRQTNHMKTCAATPKQLFVLNYELESDEFVTERILDTAQPTSSVFFTKNSMIVGANKCYEIDLSTFQADEFLDGSDVKLKTAVTCYRIGSYPLAIIEISKDPKEYLVCFNEFSVFVDEYGRSSRKSELIHSHSPLAINFVKPYLYFVQFDAVEIIKITDETCNVNSDSFLNLDTNTITLKGLKYVGKNKHGIYFTQENKVKFLDAKIGSEDSTISDLTTETADGFDRFSFTSSMMQSLDGHLSDTESKKMPFSQTDL